MTVRRELVADALGEAEQFDLRAVLLGLVHGAREALSGNFVGAYLQGSFALGAGDHFSDVDFVIVTRDEVTGSQESELGVLHARLPGQASYWAQHLEGSYVRSRALRRVERARQSWLYVDNGSRVIERSVHDNTAGVRWVLREHGIVLTGPDPDTLIDDVSAEELRGEAFETSLAWQKQVSSHPEFLDNALRQQQHVLALCRVAFTARVGEIASKESAGRWALEHLDRRWAALIDKAIADRPNPWLRVSQSADRLTAVETREFSDYVVAFIEAGR